MQSGWMGETGVDRLTNRFRDLAIDHVLLATRDLAKASRAMSERYGLRAVAGGRHPEWGTANWIVPVGDAYLELVTVVDERVAAQSAFGRWVARADPVVVRPIGWSVRAVSLDAVATRLGLTVNAGSRATPSGRLLTWRLAGVEHAAAEPILPFFIEWDENTPHPSQALGQVTNDSVAIARLHLTGDPVRLRDWLDDGGGPIVVTAGAAGLSKVVLSTAAGEVSIDASFQ